MALGRLLERLFVQVNADLSQMSSQLASGVKQTQTATKQMAMQWNSVSKSIDNLVADMKKGVITQGQYMSQLNKHASQVSALSGNYRQAQKQVFQYAASLRTTQSAAPRAFNPKPPQKFARSVGMARSQMLNLGFQLNDIGQTLATGMNPMTVLIQQGSQIVQIYSGQGGVNAALKDMGSIIGGLIRRLGPLLAVVGAVVGTLKLLQREVGIEISDNAEFQQLRDQVAGLDEDVRDSIKTFVTFGDVVKATFQVIGERIMDTGIGDALTDMGVQFSNLADFLTTAIPKALDLVVNSFRIMALAITRLIAAIPLSFNKSLLESLSVIQFRLAEILGAVGRTVEGIVNTLNETFNTDFKVGRGIFDAAAQLDELSLKSTQTAADIKSLDEQWQDFLARAKELKEETPISDLFDDIKDQSIEVALNRIRAGMEETRKEAKKMVDEINRSFEEAADNLARVFGNAFERLVETGKLSFRDFINDLNNTITRSISQSLQQELSKMFQKLLAPDGQLGTQLTNLFTALFGGSTAGFSKGGGEGDFLKKAFNFIGGLFAGGGGGGGRARGGIEMPFRNFIAGEEGPELITQDGPAGARRVTTAGQTRAMMGMNQQPIQVIMNIQTPDVNSFRQSQSQLASRANMFLARGRRNQ